MRSVSPNFNAHIQGEVTTLATCWKIIRTDGVIKTYTDCDRDILYATHTYLSIVGFTPSSIESKDDFSVDNVDVAGVLETGYITAPDLMAGLYDFAEVEIFQVNYLDLTQDRMMLRRGKLGEVRLQKDTFVAELRGLSELMQQHIGQLFSPSCRAILGDTRCTVNMASFTFAGTVNAVTSSMIFTANALTQAAGYFTGGEVRWLTGANAGLKREIKEFANKQIILALPMPYTIANGDTFNALAGCDKLFATCKAKFNNAANFRGEPHVPGTDAMLKTAGTFR
jgi:uncharacterized phage protein (TIGR02218 family)